MYNKKTYGIDPYMYDDPYTILAKAQEGYDMPIEADYKSYPAYKEAYATWLAMNRPQRVTDVSVQTPSSKRILTDYSGPSVVDFLTAQGIPSDYKTRKKIAKILNIPNYAKKDYQNLQMIDLIRQNPDVLTMLPAATSSGAVSSSRRSKNKTTPAVESNNDMMIVGEDESGNSIAVDSSGNTLTIDSSGNVLNIDSSSAGVDSTGSKISIDTSGVLPKPKGTKSSDKTNDFAKALTGMAAIAAAGGLTYASFKDAEKAAEQLAKTSGFSPTLLKSTFKKISPKIRGKIKTYENLGLTGQEIYNDIEDLIAQDEEVAKSLYKKEVKQAMKTKPLQSYTPELAKEFEEFKAKSSPQEVNMYRQLEKEAGLTKARPKGKLITGSLPTPTAPGSRAASVIKSIKQSTPVTKLNQFRKELGIGAKTANALRKTSDFISGARKFMRFQEGGENQQAAVQELMQLIATELERGTEKSEIIQMIISATQGTIDQNSANQLIEQVASQMSGEPSDEMVQMQGGADQQMMGQPEEYAYGGGYSGTYDAGSGSYFQTGGSFVPTYDNILPQYMYGAMMQEGGTYSVGETLDVSPEEMEHLRQQGYEFDVI